MASRGPGDCFVRGASLATILERQHHGAHGNAGSRSRRAPGSYLATPYIRIVPEAMLPAENRTGERSAGAPAIGGTLITTRRAL